MCITVIYRCPRCANPIDPEPTIEPCLGALNPMLEMEAANQKHQDIHFTMPIPPEDSVNFACKVADCGFGHQPDKGNPYGVWKCPGCLVGFAPANGPYDKERLQQVIKMDRLSACPFPPRTFWAQHRCSSESCPFNPQFLQPFRDQLKSHRMAQHEADAPFAKIIATSRAVKEDPQLIHLVNFLSADQDQPLAADQQPELLQYQFVTAGPLSPQFEPVAPEPEPKSQSQSQSQPAEAREKPARDKARWTEQEIAHMQQRRAQGWRIADIACELGRGFSAIEYKINRINKEARGGGAK